MGRILSIVLSLYWAANFAVSAVSWSAAERFVTGVGAPDGWAAAAHLAIGAGCAVTAALFAWLFFATLLGDDAVPGQCDEVAYTAFTGAAAVLTVTMVLGTIMDNGTGTGTGPFSMAALLASYLAVHVERRAWGRPSEAQLAEIRAAARLMALGAAHDTMVARLAPPIVPANDDDWAR
jgi:hypothetical protein